jgi:eukaryotic-like serine/threonine-protein kinase
LPFQLAYDNANVAGCFSPGIDQTMTISSGTHVGPYEILSPLGAGGMGEVYRARDTKLNRDVALKVLPEILARDPERMARFKREAQVLASLNHPNIAAIYGFEESDSTRALVMELVEGQTLAERIVRAGLAPAQERPRGSPLRDDALPIAKQIAEALEYAHEHGIIHRDLKPANIKVTPEGTVKVLDFGLAKALDPNVASGFSPTKSDAALKGGATDSPTLTAAATQAGVIIGTAAYMSPEQARGKPVDRRADIWSFGCVMYEMLAGKRMFEGDTVTDVLAAVIKTEPDWDALPAETPLRLRELIRRCLIKDPKQRLQAIGEARIAIEETIAGGGAIHESPLQAGMSPLQPWRRALLVAAGVALGATIALLATVALNTGLFRKPAPKLGPVRFEISPPEGYAIAPGDFAPEVVVSPDGGMIAVALADSKGKNSLWVRPLSATTAQKLDNTDGADLPFWSPDGQFIGFFADGKLEKIPPTGGSPQTICDAGSGEGATWSQAGVILFGQGDGPVMRVGAAGGDPVPVTELEKGKFDGNVWPQFLPDGKHFLYLAVNFNARLANSVYIGSLDSLQAKLLMKNQSAGRFYPPSHLLFVRDSTLLAQALDTGRMELQGEPIRIAEGVNAADNARAAFSTSNNGVLAFRSGAHGGPTDQAQLAWYDRKGKKLAQVGPPGDYLQAVLSPNEKFVALQVHVGTDPKNPDDQDIWLLDLTSGVYSRQTFDPATEWDPVWSPDSREILYELNKPGDPQIMELELGSSQPKKLYADGKATYLDDWSADGKFMIYHDSDNTSFHALPMTGEHVPVALWHDAFARDQVHFSPDGKWVAYNSNESGQLEVFVASFPNLEQKRQVSNGGGGEPLWRADGKELYYLSTDGSLMAVDVKAGTTIDTGPPKPLFRADILNPVGDWGETEFNVSRDGQKFLILERAKTQQGDHAEQIHVIVNWDAALGK